MSPRLKVLITILVLGIIGVAIGAYFYGKKVPGLEGVEPDYTLTANELFDNFDTDEANATKQYENKVILVTGEVMKVKTTDSTSNVILMAENAMAGGVNCSFNSKISEIEEGQTVSVKGRCQGYLMDVVLNNCVIEK